jgi:hypothetical protein
MEDLGMVSGEAFLITASQRGSLKDLKSYDDAAGVFSSRLYVTSEKGIKCDMESIRSVSAELAAQKIHQSSSFLICKKQCDETTTVTE